MKKAAMIIACAIIAGCEYTVPLTTDPELPIDKSVIGLWQRERGEGQTESLLILPLGGLEYMVSYPAGAENAMFARACLWKGDGLLLVQLNWIGTAKGDLPKDRRTFQFASYSVKDGELAVRLLNSEVVGKDAASSEALAGAISDARDKPDLFRDAMVFRRIED